MQVALAWPANPAWHAPAPLPCTLLHTRSPGPCLPARMLLPVTDE